MLCNRGCWRPLVRFPVWQEGKQSWRCIDNGRAGAHNATCEADEKIHVTSVEVGYLIAQRLTQLLREGDRNPCSVRRSVKDMKRAFRQLCRQESHARFNIICVWHPLWQQWAFAELDGLVFGIGQVVLHFNRVPAHFVAFARRWLAIPAISFFDDIKITELAGNCNSCYHYFGKMVDMMGWVFDSDKDAPPSETDI